MPSPSPSPTNTPRSEVTDGPWFVRLALAFTKQPQSASLLLPISFSCLLGWLFHHGVTVTVPEMQTAFHRQLKEERTLFRNEIKAQREHDARQTQEILARISDNQRVVAELQKLVAGIAEEVRRIKLNGNHTP